MKIIGLTGGIACGKTMLTSILRQQREIVIDADEINRTILDYGGSVAGRVIERFPCCAIEGRVNAVNRQKLGSIVFNDLSALADLEEILVPEIKKQVRSRILKHMRDGEKIVFYSNPLLYASDDWQMCDQIIKVYTNKAAQVERLMQRDCLSKEEAISRIELQYVKNRRPDIPPSYDRPEIPFCTDGDYDRVEIDILTTLISIRKGL